MEKKLFRSEDNYVFAGVAGGLGEYFEVDPTLIRLGFVVFSLLGGAGPLIYLILMIVLPKRSQPKKDEEATENQAATENNSKRNLAAYLLIGIGLVALISQTLPTWINWTNLWPAFLILAGLYFVFRK